MRNLLLATSLLLLLSGCGGKAKNIVSFTEPVHSDGDHLNVILPAKQRLVDWTSNNIDSNIIFDGNDSNFRRSSLGLKYGVSAEPLIVDGKIVFLTSDGYIRVLNEKNHRPIWSLNIIGKRTYSTYVGGGIVYHEGKLIVSNGSRNLEILDLQDGNTIFVKQFPDVIVSKPILYKNLVIVQTMGNQVYAFDVKRNTLMWDHSGNIEVITGGFGVNPVVDSEGRALVSYTSGQISLINANDGAELWQIDLSVDNSMPEFVPVNLAVQPIIEDNAVYLSDNNGKFYKLDLKTGKPLWHKAIDDVRSINNFLNILIVTTNGRQVVALNKQDGKILWAVDIANTQESRAKWSTIEVVASLLVNDMLKIYTYEGGVYTINPLSGMLIESKKFPKSVNFLTITDKIRLFAGKYILVSEK